MEMFVKILFLLGLTLAAQGLSVSPQSSNKLEGESEFQFFCRENNNIYATDIVWQDPFGTTYTPDSQSVGRIFAEESWLSITNILRNDSGIYRCKKSSNTTEFAEGSLHVNAPPAILNGVPIQELVYGAISLLRCEVDRGFPLATIHWLHVHNGTGWLSEITNTLDPRFKIVEDGLEISNVQLSDGGLYRCYVYNLYDTVQLDVQAAFSASPQFLDSSVELELSISAIGQAVKVDCTAVGVPFPNYTWSVWPESQSEKELPWNTSVVTIKGSDIISKKVHYICTATNEKGSVSRVFTVNAAIPPQPTFQQHYYTFQLDRVVVLYCNVSALPKPEFEWITTTSTVLDDFSYVSKFANQTSTSRFSHVFSKSDLDGNCTIHIVCIARNLHGTSEQFFTLHLDKQNGTCSTSVSTENPSDGTQLSLTVSSVFGSIIIIIASTLTVLIVLVFYRRMRAVKRQRLSDDISVSERALISGKRDPAFCDSHGLRHASDSLCHEDQDDIQTAPKAA